MLYARLKNPRLTGLVRQSTGGRALLISGVLVPRGEQQEEFGQLLLTEVLTLALSREYAYGLYCPLEGAASAFARQLSLIHISSCTIFTCCTPRIRKNGLPKRP